MVLFEVAVDAEELALHDFCPDYLPRSICLAADRELLVLSGGVIEPPTSRNAMQVLYRLSYPGMTRAGGGSNP